MPLPPDLCPFPRNGGGAGQGWVTLRKIGRMLVFPQPLIPFPILFSWLTTEAGEQECCLPFAGFLNYEGAEDLPGVPSPPTLFLSVWRGKWDRRKSLLWKASSTPGTLRLNSVSATLPVSPVC